MTHLILTTDSSGVGGLMGSGHADLVVGLDPLLVWGPLPSDAEIVAPLEARSSDHRLWQVYRKHFKNFAHEIGLIDLCRRCETIELWVDPVPKAQLTLIWLLDYLRVHEKIVSKLMLVQADVVIGEYAPEQLATWRLPAVRIGGDHLQAASAAWQAYRASTPQDWFDLLSRDLSVLSKLPQTVVELLEELPMRASGLGATEMRILELISEGNARPSDVFPGHRKRNKRRVFGYWEVGSLLDGLAHGPVPAVSGLEEGPFTLEMLRDRSRHARYKQSRLSLGALGEAILAGTDDFSRHNPIHRWWGGTELTNDNL